MDNSRPVPSYLRPDKDGRWLAATMILGILAPLATFLALRIPIGCSVLNFLRLPWPPLVQIPAQLLTLVVAVFAWILVIRGLTKPDLRVTSVAIIAFWLVSLPIGFIVFFFSVYGDPGTGTCVPGG
jgi:hypothetical protein